MRNKRKRLESGHGATSQAFRCTKYSLLCYRAPSQKPDGSTIEMPVKAVAAQNAAGGHHSHGDGGDHKH